MSDDYRPDTLYRKVGSRYVPAHDAAALDGLPDGTWLVRVERGGRSYCRAEHPDRAGWSAAAELARDAMLAALRRATDAEPTKRPLTARERQALAAWREIMGEETMRLTRRSAWDVVQAGLDAVKPPG